MARVLLGSGLSCATAFLWASGATTAWHTSGRVSPADSDYYFYKTSCEAPKITRTFQSTTTSRATSRDEGDASENLRTRATQADLYFAKHGEVPKPTVMHAMLDDPNIRSDGNGILVIGDVHGCYEELILLHEAALEANGGVPFRCVVLVGDLCNKGPDSARVIRFVREQPFWFAVKGNHDLGALAAALGDEYRRKKCTYSWVLDGERTQSHEVSNIALSDEDVMWLADLPFTITIPKRILLLDTDQENDQVDTIIVHAGIVPGVDLGEQTIETMANIREICVTGHSMGDENKPPMYERCIKQSEKGTQPLPWATVWRGPQRIIFGHDARRGLQRYPGDWAIGLDSGACYGKALTGIILPHRRILQVDALRVHCPINTNNEAKKDL